MPTPYFPCSPPAPGSPKSAHLSVDLPAVDILCKGNLTTRSLLWLSSLAWHVFKVRSCCRMSWMNDICLHFLKNPHLRNKHSSFGCCGLTEPSWDNTGDAVCFYWSRAAEKGNFEAAVKLGIAYLYNEGRKSSRGWG